MSEKRLKEIMKQETEIPREVTDAVEDALREVKALSAAKTGRKVTKKRHMRVILPAAAVIVVSTGVLAAGANWLTSQLNKKGIDQKDAQMIVDMEPSQETEDMKGQIYGGRMPLEKEWEEPMLTVEGAYFDGTSLHFIAKESEEAKKYDLYLRDHASINGKDALTSLQKIEDEDIYYGNIEIWNKEEAAAVLASDNTVEVVMTVHAYPIYEGQIYYTWADSEAYKKLYKTGVFTDEEGKTCYALPAKEVYAGYTPQKLTLTLPLEDKVKDIIRKYQDEGKISPIQNLPEVSSEEEIEPIPDEVEEGPTAEMIQEAQAAEINGNHVTYAMPSADGELKIDAQIAGADQEVFIGNLKYNPVPIEEVKTVYGDPNVWKLYRSEYGIDTWQYGDKHIYLSWEKERINFDISDTEEGLEQMTDSGKQEETVQKFLDKFGLSGTILKNALFTRDGRDFYDVQMMIDGVSVAELSQVWYRGYVQFDDGWFSGFFLPQKLVVQEKEAAELLSMDAIMESVDAYVKEGEIHYSSLSGTITKIRLEYYVDKTAQGIIFRPVWNFETDEGDDYFYIDAVTGAHVRNIWGWD